MVIHTRLLDVIYLASENGSERATEICYKVVFDRKFPLGIL